MGLGKTLQVLAVVENESKRMVQLKERQNLKGKSKAKEQQD